jgi:hypothetical protein
MIRKGLSVVFVALGLTACGSTPNEINQSENYNNFYLSGADVRTLNGRLAKVDDQYQLVEISYSIKSDSENAWVELDTRRPEWNIKVESDGCAWGRFESYESIKEKKGCHSLNEEQFRLPTEALGGTITGAIYSAGLLTAGNIEFDEDKYISALTEAESNFEFNGLKGRVAVQAMLVEWTKAYDFYNSKYPSLKKELASVNSIANTYKIKRVSKLPSNLKQLNYDFSSVEDISSYFLQLYSTYELISGEITSTKLNIEKKALADQQNMIAGANTVDDYDRILDKYRNSQFADKRLLELAEQKRYELINKKYETEFAKLANASDYQRFIDLFTRYSHDPKRYVVMTREKLYEHNTRVAKKQAEERIRLAKIQETKRQERLKKERDDFIRTVTAYRSTLAEGSNSHCGLVVEVKKVVASVQSMEGLQFIKIDQLYPQGYAQCKFYNGVYQAPQGLAI